jgi:hypothetical protein
LINDTPFKGLWKLIFTAQVCRLCAEMRVEVHDGKKEGSCRSSNMDNIPGQPFPQVRE